MKALKTHAFYRSLGIGLSILLLLAPRPGMAQDGGGQDQWQELTPNTVPPARFGHSLVNVDGVILVFAGEGAEQGGQPSPGASLDRAALAAPDAPGGRPTSGATLVGPLFDDVWEFDQQVNDYIKANQDNKPPVRRDHAAVGADGKMYTFGGKNENSPFSDTWILDLANNQWLFGPTMPGQPRFDLQAIVQGLTAFIVGGTNFFDEILDEVWALDLESLFWERKADVPQGGRTGHTAAVLDGLLWLFGGRSQQNAGAAKASAQNDLWVYDPAQDAWQELAPSGTLPPPRAFHAGAHDEQRLWIFGGLDDEGNVLQDVWELDVEALRWTRRADLPLALAHAQAIMLGPGQQKQVFKQSAGTASERLLAADEQVLLFGGQLADATVSDRTFLYTPVAAEANSAPSASDDTAETDEDTRINIDVLANDTDGDGDALTLSIITPPVHGAAAIEDAQISYTPAENFNGADSLVYQIDDGRGGSDQAAVSLTVTPVNDAPAAATITSPADSSTIRLEGDPSAPFVVSWTIAEDVDGDPVTYLWQLAGAVDFVAATLLMSQETGTDTLFATDLGTVARLLDHFGITDFPATLHHRVLTTDGVLTTPGDAAQLRLERGLLTATEEQAEVPEAFALHANYPNPFNPTTTIAYEVPVTSRVRLEVYDVLNRRVALLTEGVQASGRYQVVWRADRLASGVYFVRMVAEAQTATQRPFIAVRRVVLVK